MGKETLLEEFVLKLRENIPGNLNLADTLSDVLNIGKEAAYRRIRGEVVFSFEEAAVLAERFNISLDEIVGLSIRHNAVFNLIKLNYLAPLASDYETADQMLELLRSMSHEENSEIALTSNCLPVYLLVDYPSIAKFFMFKWMYRNEKGEYHTSFRQAEVPASFFKILTDICNEAKNIKSTTFIWDPSIFKYLVEDFKYFNNLGILTDSDLQDIKEELFRMIDYIETLTTEGLQHGNKVEIYISNTSFDTTYGYFCAGNKKMSLIRAFILHIISSYDKRIYEDMRNWIDSLKRQSMLISETGEMHRIQFLAAQRRMIDLL